MYVINFIKTNELASFVNLNAAGYNIYNLDCGNDNDRFVVYKKLITVLPHGIPLMLANNRIVTDAVLDSLWEGMVINNVKNNLLIWHNAHHVAKNSLSDFFDVIDTLLLLSRQLMRYAPEPISLVIVIAGDDDNFKQRILEVK